MHLRIAAPLVIALFATSLVAAAPANADGRTVLTVAISSDLTDAGLAQSVIEPGFEAANPQYDLNLVAAGATPALTATTTGASAVLMSAPAIESSFVSSGYSSEGYGRAAFAGDYALLAPENDSADVGKNLPNGQTTDLVDGFQKIAAKGNGDKGANFISRTGTQSAVIQEHAIWAQTAGVTVCTLSADLGGGAVPSTSSGPCADPIAYPNWYTVSDSTEAAAIVATSVCDRPFLPNPFKHALNCYTFTDRPSFEIQLAAGTLPNKIYEVSTPQPYSFHAYAVSPAVGPGPVDSIGAKVFLDWLTGPTAQYAIDAFRNGSSNQPFRATAAPAAAVSAVPISMAAGGSFLLTGSLKSGGAPLAGRSVTLVAAGVGGVASAVTSAAGTWFISYRPKATMSYFVTTASFTQSAGSPFVPALQETLVGISRYLGTVTLKTPTTVKISKVSVSKKKIDTVTVKMTKASGSKNVIKLYGKHTGQKKYYLLKTVKVKAGAKSVKITYSLLPAKHSWKKRTWKLKASYSGPTIVGSTSWVWLLKL